MSDLTLNRREFTTVAAGLAGGLWVAGAGADAAADDWDPDRPPLVTGRTLRVQPVLMYATFQRREQASWRSWGPINNPAAVAEETARIARELATLAVEAGFPIEILPVLGVDTVEKAREVQAGDWDVVLIFPATGPRHLLEALFPEKQPRDALIFARHENGPTYYWYEALTTAILKEGTDEELAGNSAESHGPVTVDGVVIDDYAELRRRLRALYAVKSFVGLRIVALGGAGGKYDGQAPQVAREKYRFDIVDVTYDELDRRLKALRADPATVARAQQRTDRYLALPGTTLATERDFVVRAFLLYDVFKAWMREHDAPAITINSCMGTIIPMSETTACLTLTWLNDEGLLAFCESDFVIIPPGVLLHYASGLPVFMCNSTFPHAGQVTCAHCTAPRRMDGRRYEPARLLTHYESDYGAAPKVEVPLGQEVTLVDPQFSTGRWLGFRARVRANPFLEICRSQQELEILGDWKKLLREARDSHWMLAYGDHLATVRFAARKIGIRWEEIA